MQIEEFLNKYKHLKDIDKVEITCDNPKCINPTRTLSKQAAKRNIMKNAGKEFICRDCLMKFNNPGNKDKNLERRQTDEIILVKCPSCEKVRDMKKKCYYGLMQEPYIQLCGTCVQSGKTISEEQKSKISKSLTGRQLTEEHKSNISKYANTEKAIEKAKKNLIPGLSSGWNRGQKTPEDVKKKQSLAKKGKQFTEEHKTNISEGRKKMLEVQGGLLPETKTKISEAVVKQYQNGFMPETYHRRGHHPTKNGVSIVYRSSYEKKAFMLLDIDDDVISYEYEPFKIGYIKPGDNFISYYLIDLYIIYKDRKVLVEIKPFCKLQDEITQSKIEAAKKKANELII